MVTGIRRLAALLLLPGCSVVYTQNPPENQAFLPVLECNSSYTAPILDAVLTGLSLVGLIGASTAEPTNPNTSRTGPVVTISLMAAAGAVGAVVGYRRVSACRNAKTLVYARHSPPAVEPARQELPAPTPGVALKSQNLIPVDAITERVTGPATAVFARVEGSRINQRFATAGAIFGSDRRADGTCAPGEAALLTDVPPARNAPVTTEPLVRGLVKPMTAPDLSVFSRLGIEVANTIALIELIQTSQSIDDAAAELHQREVVARAGNGGRCLYYVRRITRSRVTALTFDMDTAKGGGGAWGVNVYNNYYASDGATQIAHGAVLEIERFELGQMGLVRRPLTAAEARAFETALAK